MFDLRSKVGWLRDCLEMEGSFAINGTSDPDGIRDGNSNMIASVTRVSAGLFTVTIASPANGGPTALPYELITADAHIHQVAAPTQACRAAYVLSSWNQAAGTFQIKCLDYDTPSAVDPDDNDRISFRLVGSLSTAGTDTSY